MAYADLLVCAGRGSGTKARVKLAADLAARLGAGLIGVAAAEPEVPAFAPEAIAGEARWEPELQKAAADLSEAEALFRQATAGRSAVAWRSGFDWPVAYVAEQARAADLIVAGRRDDGDRSDPHMRVDAGDLVMTAGRPVLVVPPGCDYLGCRRAVVAWTSSREARRALCDGVPLLRLAGEVLVTTVGEDARSHGAEDVVAYLARHGIMAAASPCPNPVGTVAYELLKRVAETDADLLVAGAYGHSRLREWMFGGVTNDLLQKAPVCCLLSH